MYESMVEIKKPRTKSEPTWSLFESTSSQSYAPSCNSL